MVFQTYDANLSLADLAKVRRCDDNAVPLDHCQFYVRFLATAATNTLKSLGRVGITVDDASRERRYAQDGEKDIWRPLYLFSGPMLIIILMEAVTILACTLDSSFFTLEKQRFFSVKPHLLHNMLYSFWPLLVAPRTLVIKTLDLVALRLREIFDRDTVSLRQQLLFRLDISFFSSLRRRYAQVSPTRLLSTFSSRENRRLQRLSICKQLKILLRHKRRISSKRSTLLQSKWRRMRAAMRLTVRRGG